MNPDVRSWLRLGAAVVAYGFAFGACVGAGFGLSTMRWAA